MIPNYIQVRKGMKLIDRATGKPFTVLCSCPSSRPVNHTHRYVLQHRDEFDMPPPASTANPSTQSAPSTGARRPLKRPTPQRR